MKSLQEVFQPFTIGDTFNVPPKRLISQSQSQMSKSKTFRAPPKKTKQERQRERESALNSVKQVCLFLETEDIHLNIIEKS